jgi:hypothetical protein
VRHSDYIDACSLLAFSYKYTLTPATPGHVHADWALSAPGLLVGFVFIVHGQGAANNC